MNDDDQDEVMFGLFRSLRRELQGEYGAELAIIDNQAYQVIRLRSRIGSDDDGPRYRVMIRAGSAGISVTHRQKGYSAGAPQRQTIRYDDADLQGRIVEVVRAIVQEARGRLMDFRQSHG